MCNRLTAAAVIAASTLAACSSPPSQPAPDPPSSAQSETPRTLPDVSMPELSALPAAVQQQLRAAQAEFARVTGTGSATAVERGTAYGELGVILMSAGYRREAEAYFLHAEALAPGEMRWPYYLAHIYRKEGRAAESASAFARSLRADPEYVPSMIYLSRIHIQEGRPEAAEPLLTRAASLDPDNTAVLFGLGQAALERRDYAAAVAHLERALALDPSALRAHYPLSLAYRGLGNAEAAERHARFPRGEDIPVSDRLDVDVVIESAVGYQVRGERAVAAGQPAAGIKYLRRAVELAPDDARIRTKYGIALAMNGDLAAARREFEAVTRRWPQFAEAHYSLGVVKGQTGDVAGAVRAYEAAVRAAPTYVEARLQLAHDLRRSGRAEPSLPHYAQVIASAPELLDAWFGRAMALVAQGRYSEARDALQEALVVHPGRPPFVLALARILSAAPDDGVRDGDRALRLVDSIPDGARTIDWGATRALALAELGRFEEASAMQRQVIAVVEQAGHREVARDMGEVLARFEQRRASRTPWRAAEPMELPDPSTGQRAGP